MLRFPFDLWKSDDFPVSVDAAKGKRKGGALRKIEIPQILCMI